MRWQGLKVVKPVDKAGAEVPLANVFKAELFGMPEVLISTDMSGSPVHYIDNDKTASSL